MTKERLTWRNPSSVPRFYRGMNGVDTVLYFHHRADAFRRAAERASPAEAHHLEELARSFDGRARALAFACVPFPGGQDRV